MTKKSRQEELHDTNSRFGKRSDTLAPLPAGKEITLTRMALPLRAIRSRGRNLSAFGGARAKLRMPFTHATEIGILQLELVQMSRGRAGNQDDCFPRLDPDG